MMIFYKYFFHVVIENNTSYRSKRINYNDTSKRQYFNIFKILYKLKYSDCAFYAT